MVRSLPGEPPGRHIDHSLCKYFSYVPIIHIHLLLLYLYYLVFGGDDIDTIIGSKVESVLSHVCIERWESTEQNPIQRSLLFPLEIVRIAQLKIIGNKNPLSKT